MALQPPVSQPPARDVATLAAHREVKPPAPVAEASAVSEELGKVLADSRKAIEAVASYQVRMTHQERVNGVLNPAEEVLMSIRRTPKAVRLEWPEGQKKGREVIYTADANNGLMHVKMAPSLVPLPRISMPPDSPLATRNSRHPITEAGFESILANMEDAYAKLRKNDHSPGRLTYEGLVVPHGFSKPHHKIVRVTTAKEVWTVFIDPETRLPSSVQQLADNGDLLERYTFRPPVLNPTELARADAFDPNGRWGPSTGLLQRLARSAAEPPAPTATR